jgi:glyceraldehyde 3-phosphate dehydrogenase
MSKIKIGINGFGRIGRAFVRLNLNKKMYDIVAVNDIESDTHNMAYLLKYDSVYGKLRDDKVEVDKDILMVNGDKIKVFNCSDIKNVPWFESGVDIVIDASGVMQNVISAKSLLSTGIKKVIITHSPKQGIDFTYMQGVNEHLYNPNKHNIISSSICDANAVGPFYKLIDDAFGVELGEVTTLHPWLSYQNLLDGTLKSVSSPGHSWNDYALGRSSVGSLIPKDTTLCRALDDVIPGLSTKVHAISFRTPTSIVSAADGVFYLKNKAHIDEVNHAISIYCEKYPECLFQDSRSLVSIDYLCNEYAAVIDNRWLYLNHGKMLKFVLWYDNEWGYTSRVYKIANLL